MLIAIDWMFVSPTNSYVNVIIPSVIVFGSEDFGRYLELDEVYLDGISAFIKKKRRDQTTISIMWGYSKKAAFWKPFEDTKSVST